MYVHIMHVCALASTHIHTQFRLCSPYQVSEVVLFLGFDVPGYLTVTVTIKLLLFLKYRNFLKSFFFLLTEKR